MKNSTVYFKPKEWHNLVSILSHFMLTELQILTITIARLWKSSIQAQCGNPNVAIFNSFNFIYNYVVLYYVFNYAFNIQLILNIQRVIQYSTFYSTFNYSF